MKYSKLTRVLLLIGGFAAIFSTGCKKDYYYITPPPPVPKGTATLEAAYVATPPSSLTAPYWNQANFYNVSVKDESTGLVYGDGFLNMTGTFTGLKSFNNGTDPGLTLKAAYDKDNIYILATWTDVTMDPFPPMLTLRGPADPLKTDSAGGWTAQHNSDRLAFAFDIQNTSNARGTFSSIGCAAACHSNGQNSLMVPDAGSTDIWDWSLSLSAPQGYAEDMVSTSAGLKDDAGSPMYKSNWSGPHGRSAPLYECDGSTQNVTMANGQTAILNPTFYLLNKTPFIGDVRRGDSIYHSNSKPGKCWSCHGNNGDGNGPEGPAATLNIPAYNAFSRAAFQDNMYNSADMAGYADGFKQKDLDDIFAYLRGLGGVPGYFLTPPDGSCKDIVAISNVSPIEFTNVSNGKNKHAKYQVLIIRKLNTGNADDVQFNPATTKKYNFGVALMNDDGRNHIGSDLITLTFK